MRVLPYCYVGVFHRFGLVYTSIYARKIRKNPLSPVRESDEFFRNELSSANDSQETFGTDTLSVIFTIAAGIVWIIWGVVEKGYYIPEIATQFFIMGLVGGIIGIVFKLEA